MALQAVRRHVEVANLDGDVQTYLVLSDLRARNENLFYALLMSDPAATYMPLVYTPTVGDACQKFGHVFRQTRGVSPTAGARSRPHLHVQRRYPGDGGCHARRHLRSVARAKRKLADQRFLFSVPCFPAPDWPRPASPG
jgi:hypothetical protein